MTGNVLLLELDDVYKNIHFIINSLSHRFILRNFVPEVIFTIEVLKCVF